MTASVSTVLTIPRNAPDAITTRISTVWSCRNSPPISRSAATAASATASVGTSPNLRSSGCAANTEVSASSRPQPKNTSPSWWMPSPSGNGV